MTCAQNTTHPHPYNHTGLIQNTAQFQIQYKLNNARKTTRLKHKSRGKCCGLRDAMHAWTLRWRNIRSRRWRGSL